jgi:hypothetical protein
VHCASSREFPSCTLEPSGGNGVYRPFFWTAYVPASKLFVSIDMTAPPTDAGREALRLVSDLVISSFAVGKPTGNEP